MAFPSLVSTIPARHKPMWTLQVLFGRAPRLLATRAARAQLASLGSRTSVGVKKHFEHGSRAQSRPDDVCHALQVPYCQLRASAGCTVPTDASTQVAAAYLRCLDVAMLRLLPRLPLCVLLQDLERHGASLRNSRDSRFKSLVLSRCYRRSKQSTAGLYRDDTEACICSALQKSFPRPDSRAAAPRIGELPGFCNSSHNVTACAGGGPAAIACCIAYCTHAT